MSLLEFSLATTTIPIVLKDVDGKKPLSLELREMTAAQRDKHLDSIRARATLGEKGELVINRFEGMQADLLVLCLFRSDGNGVSREEIQKWPAAVVQKIYDAAQELNSLKVKGPEEKND